ncbi:MAG: phytoene desaturase family protein [Bryobacteraceae bacterium]
MRVVVVGAGLGGLATALRLQAGGWQVTVLDNGPTPGGKMNRWTSGGYKFDTGPTLLTMPQLLRQLYEDLGERLEEHLELTALDPHAEYVYPDGVRLRVPARFEDWLRVVRDIEREDAEGIQQLHLLGERIYRLSELTFFRQHPLTPLRPPPREALRCFPLRHVWGNYAKTVERFLRNSRLKQIYLRYPTYVGSSPYRCPATLLVIPYIEHAFGVWYVRGGMYRLAESLASLACERGVEMVLGAEVVRIENDGRRVTGVTLASGERVKADRVVYNGDAARLGLLLGGQEQPPGRSRSLSGVVWLTGMRRRLPGLHHHTVLFSSDYQREFEELFDHRRFPTEPTVYVNAPTEPTLAPPEGQAVYLMANAPGNGGIEWYERNVAEAKRRILARVRRAGLPDVEAEAEVQEMWEPARMQRRFLAPGGAIYGENSHGWRKAFLRPPNRFRHLRGLYCVGGSFHPGGGVPMVLLSAEMAAGLMQQEGSN